jgi:hypothetical protein
MNTIYIFWTYLAQIFLEWEMFQTDVVDKIKTHILCSILFFFLKSCILWYNVKKCGSAWQATDDNMAYAHCILDTKGYKHTLRICITHCFSTATVVVQTCLSVKVYVVHWLSCLLLIAVSTRRALGSGTSGSVVYLTVTSFTFSSWGKRFLQ